MTPPFYPIFLASCELGGLGGVWGHLQCPDSVLSPRDSYIPRDNSLQSETVHYKRGVCQQFCVPSHTVDPSEWSEEEVGPTGLRHRPQGRVQLRMRDEASITAPSHQASPPVSLQLGFDLDREVYPMVVHAVVDEGEGEEGVPCWVGLAQLLAPWCQPLYQPGRASCFSLLLPRLCPSPEPCLSLCVLQSTPGTATCCWPPLRR